MYSFRIRAKTPPSSIIDIDVPTRHLKLPGKSFQVVLHSINNITPIKDAKEIIISAGGFPTAEEANAAGMELQDMLALAFAYVRFPVDFDFGNREPKGGFTKAGSEMLEKHTGRKVLNDEYGLVVFQTEPSPVFASFSAGGSILIKLERLEKAIHQALEKSLTINPHNRPVYDLFSASFFATTADTRFLLLMMAVETYIELESRSNEVIKHVDFLISETNKSDSLTVEEKDSLKGSLQHLKKESFRQAGRRVAKTLSKKAYKGMHSTQFFNSCYDIRTKLVHGYVPRPTSSEVGSLAATLEVFVSDLLSIPLCNTY